MKMLIAFLLVLMSAVVVGIVVIKSIDRFIPVTESVTIDPTKKYDVATLDLNEGQLEMFWKNGIDDAPNFSSLGSVVDEYSGRALFATNGGMFDADGDPIGLYIENGVELKSLNQKTGSGNFHIEPNGVFYVTDEGAKVVTTREFLDVDNKINFATQSGPMLVVGGKVNDQFTEGSENKHIRSGVCATTPKNLTFIISNQTVNFFEFASEFKNRGCDNALYLDGFVSQMYAPEIGREDLGGAFGVVIVYTQ